MTASLTSPAIAINGGKLPQKFIEKVCKILPGELDLHLMLVQLRYDPKADESVHVSNKRLENSIKEAFQDILIKLEEGNNFDGRLDEYFGLAYVDGPAFLRLQLAGMQAARVSCLLEEFNWILGDDQVYKGVWDMDSHNTMLVPVIPEYFL